MPNIREFRTSDSESTVLITKYPYMLKSKMDSWSMFSGTSWYSFSPCTQFESPWFHSIVIWRIPGSPSSTTAFRAFKLEATRMVGHNILEAFSFEIDVDGYETEKLIGSIIQNVEKVLVKPGWSAIRQVFFKISITLCCLVSREDSANLSEALQSLLSKYLSPLAKLESVAFNFSASVVKCVQYLSTNFRFFRLDYNIYIYIYDLCYHFLFFDPELWVLCEVTHFFM